MIYTPLTKKALKISFEAHKNQTDKSGMPYVYHPFHLAEQMGDQYAVCVALLHDTVEDAGISLNDLRREGFPEIVIEAVALMTHDKNVPYLEYVRRLMSNPLAKKVKLADLKHNSDLSRLDTVTKKDTERVEKYKKAIALLESGENPNVTILNQTLDALSAGYYLYNGRVVPLKTGLDRMREVRVYLPDEVGRICAESSLSQKPLHNRCKISCENTDSFTMAREMLCDPETFARGDRVLVLNYANPVNIGGGVRRGAKAQEEDLCRQSSLLLSLESEEAAAYYRYNRALHTMLGSDAMIISPNVEIIRDGKAEWLEETAVISVLTCAAPYLRDGTEGKTYDEYIAMTAHRIRGMLCVAAREGYTHLVLGAWGCGAFGNDAKLIARLFSEEIERIGPDTFKHIGFSVLCKDPGQYNYRVFSSCFERFVDVTRDRIKGCLIGGAAGDALGYAVEFCSESTIFSQYGADGITEYHKDPAREKAIISDDTQMTLFTACGILNAATKNKTSSDVTDFCAEISAAYCDWYHTQNTPFAQREMYPHCTWLWDVPELFAPRAPGNTCLSAIHARLTQGDPYSTGKAHNNSKGCGGVMRVAPTGLYRGFRDGISAARAAEKAAALTHGHPLGYLSAALMAHIIHDAVFCRGDKTLRQITEESLSAVQRQYHSDADGLAAIIGKALAYSENDDTDLDNIHRLGEGWVGEEALAIALYCCLRYTDDFDLCIIAAVNHKGDSDSTGAIAGNIIGAWLGYSAIGEKWTRDLELADVICELSDDLSALKADDNAVINTAEWQKKYHRNIE